MGVRESKIERYLIGQIILMGGVCAKWGTDGYPDRVISLNGNVYFVEVKTKDGVLRPNQQLRIEQLVNTGCFVTVVSGYEEVDDLIKQLESLDMLRHTLTNADPSKS